MIYASKNPSRFLIDSYEDIIREARCQREIKQSEEEIEMLALLYFVAVDVPSDVYTTNVLHLHLCDQ